jgi:hypothetical protein
MIRRRVNRLNRFSALSSIINFQFFTAQRILLGGAFVFGKRELSFQVQQTALNSIFLNFFLRSIYSPIRQRTLIFTYLISYLLV